MMEDMEQSFDSENDVIGPSDEEEEVLLTPKEILSRIEIGWMNEKLAPELLPPIEAEKDAMMEQIKIMERNLNKLDKKDVRTEIHKLEVERIRFIVVSYMRVRLFKIQEMAWFLMKEENKRPRGAPSLLMDEELLFLKNFTRRTEEYMKVAVTSNFPTALQPFDSRKFQKLPHMDAYVFFRPIDERTIEYEDENDVPHLVHVKPGEQHVMRYEPLSPLLFRGAINLV